VLAAYASHDLSAADSLRLSALTFPGLWQKTKRGKRSTSRRELIDSGGNKNVRDGETGRGSFKLNASLHLPTGDDHLVDGPHSRLLWKDLNDQLLVNGSRSIVAAVTHDEHAVVEVGSMKNSGESDAARRDFPAKRCGAIQSRAAGIFGGAAPI
jgi:hypothetical protein